MIVLISHAVTKGLNPDAPMKDSGVEWLGEVPGHWGIKRLEDVLARPTMNGLFKTKDSYGSGSALINVGDLYEEDNFINIDKLGRIQTTSKERELYRVLNGDIFFVRSSLKLEGIGRSACFDTEMDDIVFECHIVKATPDVGKVLPRFLIRYLNSVGCSQEFIRRSKTTTMTTIEQAGLTTVPVAVPPIDEQVEIDKYLTKYLEKVKSAAEQADQSIALLQERRTALISAAVTGKIDVRDWKPPKDFRLHGNDDINEERVPTRGDHQ